LFCCGAAGRNADGDLYKESLPMVGTYAVEMTKFVGGRQL
jgi:hypothetical protein